MQIVNVADIKVKEGVTAEGTRAGQKWQLVIITGDDGSEFTTFDIKAKEVGIGGVIELEPVIKNGKTNFTKFTIKKKGVAPVPAATIGGDDSPVKRNSIENQSRAERITELWIAGKIADDDSLVTKLRAWLDQLGSAKAEPKAELVTNPKEQPKTETKIPETFKNVGEFLTAMKQKGLSRTEVVDELIRLKMITSEADLPKLNLVEAWEALGDAIIPA